MVWPNTIIGCRNESEKKKWTCKKPMNGCSKKGYKRDTKLKSTRVEQEDLEIMGLNGL